MEIAENYKLTEHESIIRLSDNACIPNDPRNSDYAAYLKWLEEGNTPEPVPEPTFEEAKTNLQAQINALFKAETAALKANVQQEEVDTFDSQKQEALAYQADNTADVPLLSGLATVRGLTVAELAGRVLAHADAYKTAMGQIMGKKHAYEDQLALAETIEDLNGIEII